MNDRLRSLHILPAVALAAAALAVVAAMSAFAENIDPVNNQSQYAWGENAGWINAEPSGEGGPGVNVTGSDVTGFMWGENVGWINMSCSNDATCGSVSYGVRNDEAGNLSGYAWGENVGWISFSCANTNSCGTSSYGVTINPANGQWSGFAWGENIGWIKFRAASPVAFGVTSDDKDEISGAVDNCAFDNNPAQTNTDAVNTSIGLPGADTAGDACDADDDGDGCTDVQETGLNPTLGGDRNPLDPWDFYDVTGSRSIDLVDTLAVLQHFGHGPNDDPLDQRLDRYSPDASKPWRTAEANNGVTLLDALASLKSFGHHCQ
jgi:hypothetical protein